MESRGRDKLGEGSYPGRVVGARCDLILQISVASLVNASWMFMFVLALVSMNSMSWRSAYF